MEARLADVEALVQQRWERAQEKQRRNGALERRKQALVDELKALIASSRSVNEAGASELEARILKLEREVEERRREVALRHAALARKRSRRLVLDAQIKQLQTAIDSERKKNTCFFGQVAADKQALEETTRQQQDQDRAELEERRRALLYQLDRVQEAVGAAQSKVRDNGNTMRALEDERSKLKRELRDAVQLNASLKKRVEVERQQTSKVAEATRHDAAQALEARANSIRKELADMCA